MSVPDITTLRKFIAEHFNLEEVRTLCLDLGTDYDDLPGEGKLAKVRELIAHCQRRNRLPDLVADVELERGPIFSPLSPPLTLPPEAVSAPVDPQALKVHFREFSAGLATLCTDIPGPPFESDKLPEVAELCLQPDSDQGRIILVTEEPGGGKTVFLSLLYRRIADQVPVLAIQPERYPEGNGLVERVRELLEQALALGPAVLLLDSLDVLAATQMAELQDWLRLLDRLKLRSSLTVVTACRSFEARYVPPLSSQQWSQTLTVGLPPTEWVARVLRKAANVELDGLPAATRELLRVPLHLALAVEIAERGGHLDDLTSLHALYGRLLDIRGVDSRGRQVLFALAGEMLRRRMVDLPRSLALDETQLNGLARTGMIQRDGDVVRLRHQTMRDYLLARRAVEGEQTLREFLDEFGQSLAVHPTLRHLLGFLRRQPQRLAREVQALLTDPTVRFHIKAGVLGVMASWPDPSPGEAALLVRLFHESGGERLDMQFFSHAPHSGWFPRLLDGHLRPAAVDRAFGAGARSRALDYLTQTASVYPSEILGVARELLKHPPDRDLWVFFDRLSDALASLDLDPDTQATFADVSAGVVERGFEWHSFSIVGYCQRLAAIDPGRGLALFFATLNRQRAEGCEGSNEFAWRRSVGEYFDRLLPEIYEHRPHETLAAGADFFESFFSADYEATTQDRAILDSPVMRLYAETPHYHDDAFFDWFRRRAIAFAEAQPAQAAPLIEKLRVSPWQTLQHLAHLMMLPSPKNYAGVLFVKAAEILAEPPKVDDRYLLLHVLTGAFTAFSPLQRDQLTQTILDYPIRERRDERHWIHEPLNHIPEDLRSPAVQARVAELSAQFGPYRYISPVRASGVHAVPSPVPGEQLAHMTPMALYECLVANRALEDRWDYEAMTSTGGVEQLAAEAAKVITADLPRYAEVLTRLADDPANYIYLDYTLSQVEVAAPLAGWFVDLAQRIYRDERIQLSLARALRSAVGVVTSEQWTKLKPICLHLATAPDPERDRYLEARQQGYHNDALTDGINSTRGAMAEVLVRAAQRFWDDDLRLALERLANDPTVSVRAALLYVLPYLLGPAGWEVCFHVFRRAFRPNEPEFAPLAPRFLRYAPREAFEADVYPLLVAMRAVLSGPIAEVSGQLTAFYALRGWLPAEELEAVLFGKEVPIEVNAKVVELVSHWASSPDYVEQCLTLLTRVATDGPDALVNQFDRVFLDLPPADLPRAREFIAALLARPARGEADFWLLDYLEKALPIWPVETFEALEAILAQAQQGMTGYGFMQASRSEVPLRIATFVLEAYPDLETRALDALDRLIALRWRGTNEYLRATHALLGLFE